MNLAPRCYRLQVIAPTAADAAQHAGGWLFDHVMAGWKVVALLADCTDPRPLQILGAEVAALESAMTPEDPDDLPEAVTVATELYTDSRVQRLVRAAGADVLVWDRTPATGQRAIHYRLGAAARAFKAEALAAAGIRRAPLEPEETFRAATGRPSQRGLDLEPFSALSLG